MKEQFSLLSRSRSAIVTITIVSLTAALINTTFTISDAVDSLIGTNTGLAFAADAGVGVTTNSSIATNNSSQIKVYPATVTGASSEYKDTSIYYECTTTIKPDFQCISKTELYRGPGICN